MADQEDHRVPGDAGVAAPRPREPHGERALGAPAEFMAMLFLGLLADSITVNLLKAREFNITAGAFYFYFHVVPRLLCMVLVRVVGQCKGSRAREYAISRSSHDGRLQGIERLATANALVEQATRDKRMLGRKLLNAKRRHEDVDNERARVGQELKDEQAENAELIAKLAEVDSERARVVCHLHCSDNNKAGGEAWCRTSKGRGT
eukprot:g15599.t1